MRIPFDRHQAQFQLRIKDSGWVLLARVGKTVWRAYPKFWHKISDQLWPDGNLPDWEDQSRLGLFFGVLVNSGGLREFVYGLADFRERVVPLLAPIGRARAQFIARRYNDVYQKHPLDEISVLTISLGIDKDCNHPVLYQVGRLLRGS